MFQVFCFIFEFSTEETLYNRKLLISSQQFCKLILELQPVDRQIAEWKMKNHQLVTIQPKLNHNLCFYLYSMLVVQFRLICDKLMIRGFSSYVIKNWTLNSYFILFILYSTVDKAYDMYLNNFLRRQIRQKWRRLSSVGGLHKDESCGCRQLHKGKRS